MNHSELGNPRPRDKEEPFIETAFSVSGHRYLEIPNHPSAVSIWDAVEGRASRRGLRPIDTGPLSTLLWFTAKTRLTKHDAEGFTWQRRPVPSAGGRHPIDIMVIERPQRPTLTVYDAAAHALCDLAVADNESLQSVVQEVNEITMNDEGAILLFVANFGRTMAKYENGESLVWRDSGALLAMCYLVSEGLGLGCCGIGVTGEPWVSSLLGNAPGVRGVGGCVIGARGES